MKTAIVLVCFLLVLVNITTKGNLEEEWAYLVYISKSQSTIEASQSGTEAEAMEDAAFCLPNVQIVSLGMPREWHCLQWAGLSHTTSHQMTPGDTMLT